MVLGELLVVGRPSNLRAVGSMVLGKLQCRGVIVI